MRVLGVPVGSIVEVAPEGTRVRVEMRIDDPDLRLPADAKAVVVSPEPGHRPLRPARADLVRRARAAVDGAVIPVERTAVPLGVDDLARTATELADALGPNGVNAKGALVGRPRRRCRQPRRQRSGGERHDPQPRRAVRHAGRLPRGPVRHRHRAAVVRHACSPRTTPRSGSSTSGSKTSPVSSPTSAATSPPRCASCRSRSARWPTSSGTTARCCSPTSTGSPTSPRVLVEQRNALAEILDVAPAALGNLAQRLQRRRPARSTPGRDINELTLPPEVLVCDAAAQLGGGRAGRLEGWRATGSRRCWTASSRCRARPR